MRFSRQAARNAATSGPSRRHMSSGLVSIDRPCSEYSGNTTRSMPGILRRAFAARSQMRRHCAARSPRVATTGCCSCTRPSTTPPGDLLRPPSPFIAFLRSTRVSSRVRKRVVSCPSAARKIVRANGRGPLAISHEVIENRPHAGADRDVELDLPRMRQHRRGRERRRGWRRRRRGRAGRQRRAQRAASTRRASRSPRTRSPRTGTGSADRLSGSTGTTSRRRPGSRSVTRAGLRTRTEPLC